MPSMAYGRRGVTSGSTGICTAVDCTHTHSNRMPLLTSILPYCRPTLHVKRGIGPQLYYNGLVIGCITVFLYFMTSLRTFEQITSTYISENYSFSEPLELLNSLNRLVLFKWINLNKYFLSHELTD